jgi:16S rRNA (uracil1498-N3)-methyltransferase
MTLFFVPQISHPLTELPEEEAHHAMRVLRLKNGQDVWVTDGKGKIYQGQFEAFSNRNARVLLAEEPAKVVERKANITMAVAPLKSNDRFEWFLEKATELGATRIVPIISEHGERSKFNMERWHRVMLAALKQSLNPLMPQLDAPIKFADFLKSNTLTSYIAHCEEGEKPLLAQAIQKGEDICICIGPEGDFSASEIKQALEKKYQPVSLGELRLRTETAALTALITGLNSLSVE